MLTWEGQGFGEDGTLTKCDGLPKHHEALALQVQRSIKTLKFGSIEMKQTPSIQLLAPLAFIAIG